MLDLQRDLRAELRRTLKALALDEARLLEALAKASDPETPFGHKLIPWNT